MILRLQDAGEPLAGQTQWQNPDETSVSLDESFRHDVCAMIALFDRKSWSIPVEIAAIAGLFEETMPDGIILHPRLRWNCTWTAQTDVRSKSASTLIC
jgi:hypothetical protein